MAEVGRKPDASMRCGPMARGLRPARRASLMMGRKIGHIWPYLEELFLNVLQPKLFDIRL